MEQSDNFKQKCLFYFIMATSLMMPIIMAFFFKITDLFPDIRQAIYSYLFPFLLTGIFSFYVKKKKVFNNKYIFYSFCLILLVTLFSRVFLFPLRSGDYNNFLYHWIRQMQFMGWPWQIAVPITNYNLLYTYILAVILHVPFSDLFLIKSVSVIFDVILGIVVLFILKKSLKLKEINCLLGFTLSMIIPSLFLNSAAWGQCDSMYTACLLIGIYLILKEKPKTGCLLLGLSISLKLQAAFVFPILLFLIAYKQIKFRHLFLIPITYFIIMLPALSCGRTLSSAIGIYFNQVQTFSSLSMGLPSLWEIIHGNYTFFLPLALSLSIIIVFLFTMLTLFYKNLQDKKDFWDILFIYALIVPYFLPKMHERYFYMAIVLSIIYLFNHPKMWMWIFGISLIDMCLYLPYLLGYSFCDRKYLALCYLVIILKILIQFFTSQDPKNNIPIQTNEENIFKSQKKSLIAKNLFILCGISSFIISFFILSSDFQGNISIKKQFTVPFWVNAKKVNVKHPGWNEELVFLSDDRIFHLSHMNMAEVIRFNDTELWVKWDGNNEEHFVKENSSNSYNFTK
ncbi:MAG: hypothetical protein SPL08_03155 [Pseudomonadota bacterium]|nr:hypothetical protein [Pseudomonadota bacterium]